MDTAPIGSSGGLRSLFGLPEQSGQGSLSGLFARGDDQPAPGGLADIFDRDTSEPGQLDSLFSLANPAAGLPDLSAFYAQVSSQALGSKLAALGIAPEDLGLATSPILDLFASAAPASGEINAGSFLSGPTQATQDAVGSILGAYFAPQFELLGDVLDALG